MHLIEPIISKDQVVDGRRDDQGKTKLHVERPLSETDGQTIVLVDVPKDDKDDLLLG